MGGRSRPEVTDAQMETVLGVIDEDTGRSVEDIAESTGYSPRKVQLILEALMDQGKITSTPDWQYRESRRPEAGSS